jgi:hypothetical protein
MADTCTHLPDDLEPPEIVSEGCQTCLVSGRRDWVHLRFCQTCGRVGCCDSSPGRHASRHAAANGHPILRSFEPGEDWWWCYPDDLIFEVEGAPKAPSYRE